MRKSIKNYTSGLPVNRSLQNICDILSSAGASKIMVDYDSTHNPCGVAFFIEIPDYGAIPYKLPVQVENLSIVMFKARLNSLKEKEKEQVRRTAWKNVHDWIDAQMALISTQIVKLEQVFLPYAVDQSGQTLFEKFQNGSLLSLPGKEEKL